MRQCVRRLMYYTSPLCGWSHDASLPARLDDGLVPAGRRGFGRLCHRRRLDGDDRPDSEISPGRLDGWLIDANIPLKL
jgi:hypothetical protein